MPAKTKHIHLKDMTELVDRSVANIKGAPGDWLFNFREIMYAHIDYTWSQCPHCSQISSKSLINLALIIGWQAGRDKWKLSQKRDPEELSGEELIELSGVIGELASFLELPMECPNNDNEEEDD